MNLKFFAFFISIRVIILIRYENTKVKEKCDEPFPSQLEDLEIYLTHATFPAKREKRSSSLRPGQTSLRKSQVKPMKEVKKVFSQYSQILISQTSGFS